MTTFNSGVQWETAQLLRLAVVLATEPGTTTIYSFWPDFSMVKNQLNNYRIWIQIFTKIESIRPCDTPKLSTKFRPNLYITFLRYHAVLLWCRGSVARMTARRSSWAVSHRTPELKVVTTDNSEVDGSLNGPWTPIFRPRG